MAIFTSQKSHRILVGIGSVSTLVYMSILDVFDRAVVTNHIGLTCGAKHLVQITQEALLKRQLFDKAEKLVIRSDNGPQFISNLFEDVCNEFVMIHERIPPKTPNKNAHIESYHSIIEAECYQRHEFESYPQAYEVVGQFIQDYNRIRIHGSIYDLSPYRHRWKTKQFKAILRLISNKRCSVHNKGVEPHCKRAE